MIIDRFRLDRNSKVVQIASNDGYLLKNFVARGIPVLGVEPAAKVAEVASGKGIPTKVAFFGEKTARDLTEDGWAADLIIGNNVLAHVPELNDFVSGLKVLLKPTGLVPWNSLTSFSSWNRINLIRSIMSIFRTFLSSRLSGYLPAME